MLAVYGTAVFCGGLLFFFSMLHLHRRPGVAQWLEFPGVGAITLYVSMMASLYGIAMWGQYGVKQATPFGMMEGIEVAVILVATVLAIRKLYLPPPPPKEEAGAGGRTGDRPVAQKRAA